jgi:pimeloyl-ACP methyl ester carboxylesterase
VLDGPRIPTSPLTGQRHGGSGIAARADPPGVARVGLDTHIQDVVNVLFYADLREVILVGHSYGGNVITGVADRVPERLRQLVYLDAATPSDGQASADSFPGRRDQIEEQARREGDGWKVPPGAVPPDQPAEITEWARPRRGPMTSCRIALPTGAHGGTSGRRQRR